MRNSFFIGQLLLIVMILISPFTRPVKEVSGSAEYSRQNILGCGPASDDISDKDVNGKYISLLSGWGYHSYTITTNSDSAQIYFNQGLSFYYSFHMREANASFKEAARFDSTCAMAYWGQALASGPYYNEYSYKMKKGIIEALQEMDKYSEGVTAKEKDLMQAMKQRYSGDTTNADRPQLDKSYATGVYPLIKKYSNDNDIKAMYIDAMMLVHKWDFWNNDGTPKSWTPELVSLCEEILKDDPYHPAALHYYIHLTEASKQTKLALRGADVLKETMPGVGHMVHMATHMYQRNGLFVQGVEVNEEANNVYNAVDSIAPMLKYGKNGVLHIYAVQSYCAMNAGMYKKSIPVYSRARERVTELKPQLQNDTYNQFVYMMPVIAWVRLGKWDEILESPSPLASWKFARVFDDFARGMAHVHHDNIIVAKRYLDSIQINLNDSLLNVRLMPFNSPAQSGRIAASILKAEILYEENKWDECIRAFNDAVDEEDKQIYREPPDWYIPARQYLGAYLLKMNKAKEAEKIYKEDLVWNPGNGWSLLGMYQSLVAQGRKDEAAVYRGKYMKAFEGADVEIKASVF
jgi:tetratricopeptide (TPR) repeat protein